MTAHTRLDPPLVESIRKALTRDALPGETQGLGRDAERGAAEFLAAVAANRKRGELALRIELIGGDSVNRRMRLAIVNDDMPFLVDSIAAAIAAHDIAIDRILHPVVAGRRDDGATRARSTRSVRTTAAQVDDLSRDGARRCAHAGGAGRRI